MGQAAQADQTVLPEGDRRWASTDWLGMHAAYVLAQQCLWLSDEGIEDPIYDNRAIRCFVGIDLNCESAQEASTLPKFCHMVEANDLTRQIFDTINGHLPEKGLMMREGSIVDTTLIAAPPSTEQRDNV